MTTNTILIPLAAGDGLEETPSGRMSSEWLDAVWAECNDIFQRQGLIKSRGKQFSRRSFQKLATMQDVGPEEAAKRLTGEGEE